MFRKIRKKSSRIMMLALVLMLSLSGTGFVSIEKATLHIQNSKSQSGNAPVEALFFVYAATAQQAARATFASPQFVAQSGSVLVSALSSNEKKDVETASDKVKETDVQDLQNEVTSPAENVSDPEASANNTPGVKEEMQPTDEPTVEQTQPELTVTEASPAPAAEVVAQQGEQLYNVPLADDVQRFIKKTCQDYDIPFDLVMAIIEHESNYNASAISATGDYGLMQINRVNHGWMRSKLGLTDMLDPYQNVTGGTYLINYYMDKTGNDVTRSLLMYQYGEGGAKNKTWSPFVQEVADIRAALSSKVRYV